MVEGLPIRVVLLQGQFTVGDWLGVCEEAYWSNYRVFFCFFFFFMLTSHPLARVGIYYFRFRLLSPFVFVASCSSTTAEQHHKGRTRRAEDVGGGSE